MKKLIITTALTLLFVSAAYAADDKATDQQSGMVGGGDLKQGDMMKKCQSHMKDGKMMANMPKATMAKCQTMMKDGMMHEGMMRGDKSDMPSGKAPMMPSTTRNK
ncbi:MAG: hypothetical protein HYX63_00110 [Gammaproteobacteria bacterium]|nr:hypothetical protein [Gammaproteobacteria bacterium]